MEKQPWEVLGEEFVKQYYNIFDNQPRENLMPLYHVRSWLVYFIIGNLQVI